MINFAQMKELTIPEGQVIKIAYNGTTLWEKILFTNQVPISTDTDGSIFNGVGYKENVRLGSNGSISSSAQNGSVTTGFIPFPTGDKTVIRIKGATWMDAIAKKSGHYYMMFYTENKTKCNDYSYVTPADDNISHVFTKTKDANGVETFSFSQTYGTTNTFLQAIRNTAKFFRITAYGEGKDFIVTVNEEIA